jgi:hypothetical protein
MVEATLKAQNLDQIVLEVFIRSNTIVSHSAALTPNVVLARPTPQYAMPVSNSFHAGAPLRDYHVKVRRHWCITDKRDRPSFGRTGGYRHKYYLPWTWSRVTALLIEILLMEM